MAVDKNSFEYVSSKLGNVKPETKLIAKELFDAAKKAGHQVWFMWGMGGGKEHGSGLALDLMVRNEAAGDFLRDYIWANRSRLRLHHVIWEQHITSTVVQPGVRRKMADRGSTTENHYDHNHVWFFPGEYVPPVKLGGGTHAPIPKPPAKPPVVIVRTLHRGCEGDDVKRLQSELRRVFPAYAGQLARDGSFGPKTEAAVREFQHRAGLAIDGRVGPKTRTKLKAYGVRL
jgi:hypothetical protein